ncbi:ATP-binding domain-containing protein [Pandoraea sp. B-6]|uniref:ATP-binding domain-containing protein n=1 Tax=Pandoraea sp. B-6 TaxID=1204340 RepID=UPI0009FFD5BC
MSTSRHFSDARIDLRMEFAQARHIQAHPDISTVLAGLAYQRSKGNDRAPSRSISTIHKSKGLECGSAILIPCDAGSLAHNQKNRCLLYVALSRSCEQLTLVIPEANRPRSSTCSSIAPRYGTLLGGWCQASDTHANVHGRRQSGHIQEKLKHTIASTKSGGPWTEPKKAP